MLEIQNGAADVIHQSEFFGRIRWRGNAAAYLLRVGLATWDNG